MDDKHSHSTTTSNVVVSSDRNQVGDAAGVGSAVACAGGAKYKLMSPAKLPISRSAGITIPPGLSPTSFLESPVLLTNIKAEPSPTTGSFFKSALMQGSSGTAAFSLEANCSARKILDDSNPVFFEFRPHTQTASVQPFSSAGFQISTGSNLQLGEPSGQYHNHNQNKNQSESQSYPSPSTSNWEMTSPKEKSITYMPHEETNGLGKPKDSGPTILVDRSSDDGYNWRKYGQKVVKGSEHPRSYYKCTHPNCEVKKIFERSYTTGQITEIVYKGTHDHPKPQPSRRLSAGALMSIQEENHDKLQYANFQAGLSANNGQNPNLEASGTPLQSPRQANQDSTDEADDEEDQYLKKRRTDFGTLDVTPVVKPIREPRVVVQTTSEVDILDDGYRWRKYGQKVVRGNPNPRFKYDVFLSFRGEDTRKTFVDHLHHALDQKSIIVYKDDVKIKKGKRIGDELIASIEDSKFYIIVFSKGYASSSWCLEELVKIMECQKMSEHTAYPVFYDVEPTQVRKQIGAVGDAIAKHKEEDTVKWREALREAANLAGWDNLTVCCLTLTYRHEAKLIQKIVEEISLELRFVNYSVDAKLVGMETRVKDVVSSLESGVNDVCLIGIKGMGGSGKTTLARAVFDQISFHFEGKSFVENVREVSKDSKFGLKQLQKQVLRDVLNDQSIGVTSLYNGKNMMEKMMRSRKVLIVLDDVDHIDQLEALAGETGWFKPGSKIIITTRDKQVLEAHQVNFIHDINLFTHEEAICLFSRYAFGKEIPNQGYEKLSEKVVRYADGLPLTIRVLGSLLCGKAKSEWVDTLERLKTIPLKQTLEMLELSYIGLEEDHKEIFLDVACILRRELKDEAIKILECCGFHAQIGLKFLEQKCLITVSKNDRLCLHDHIEEMGRNIVRRLHPTQPNKHSRLWIQKEIEDILVNELGTEATKCIKLQHTDLHPTTIMKGLIKMKELRFLYMSNRQVQDDILRTEWKFDEASQYLPNSLRFLRWHYYPFWCLPKSFEANNLVNLEMCFSNITQLWEGGDNKVPKELYQLSCLRELTFSLKEIKHLPASICMLKHLKSLELKSCLLLEKLPDDLGQLECLEKLILIECVHIRDIPNDICKIKCLKYLHLRHCIRVEKLPEELGRLECLIELNIEGTSISHLPQSISQLKGLRIIDST
ncbi:hypothetical protein E3N88_08682 [Mikania micrantha]|uniref:Uncharacterized protein n=1 Tax=Mikania micrantha TaxID=192012 RepID=A0A5N6PJ66_9ASTR|nr:hypothetical protein E3N88_08682 [Mikania micrantha]